LSRTKWEIRVNRDKSGSFEDYCFFKTNDANMKIGKASVKGIIFSPVRIGLVPNRCEFGKVTTQKWYSKTIKIQNAVGVDQTAVHIKAISNMLQNQIRTKLDDEWKEETKGQVNLREISLTIDLFSDLPPGYYRDEVVVTFDRGGEYSIPVSFYVKPFVEAYPSVCVFHFSRGSIYRKIALKTDGDTGFTIDSIKANLPWIKVHELTLEVIDKQHKFSRGAIELSGKIGNQNWTLNIPVISLQPH